MTISKKEGYGSCELYPSFLSRFKTIPNEFLEFMVIQIIKSFYP